MNQLVPVIVLYNWNGPKYTSNILFIYVSNRLMNRGSCIVFLICRKTIVKCKILITNADLTVTNEYWISYMHLATNWQCRGVSMTCYTPDMILLHSWHCYIRFYKYHIYYQLSIQYDECSLSSLSNNDRLASLTRNLERTCSNYGNLKGYRCTITS